MYCEIAAPPATMPDSSAEKLVRRRVVALLALLPPRQKQALMAFYCIANHKGNVPTIRGKEKHLSNLRYRGKATLRKLLA